MRVLEGMDVASNCTAAARIIFYGVGPVSLTLIPGPGSPPHPYTTLTESLHVLSLVHTPHSSTDFDVDLTFISMEWKRMEVFLDVLPRSPGTEGLAAELKGDPVPSCNISRCPGVRLLTITGLMSACDLVVCYDLMTLRPGRWTSKPSITGRCTHTSEPRTRLSAKSLPEESGNEKSTVCQSDYLGLFPLNSCQRHNSEWTLIGQTFTA